MPHISEIIHGMSYFGTHVRGTYIFETQYPYILTN